MASARKTHARTVERRHLPPTEAYAYACFMQDLLEGKIQATTIEETRDGRGVLTSLSYNDPDG